MAWDLSFKRALKYYFEKHGFVVHAGFELAKSNQFIDFIIENNHSRIPHPFQYGASTVIGEFKSNRDKVSVADFYMLLAKSYYYLALVNGYGKKRKQHSLDFPDVSCAMVLGGDLKIPKRIVATFRFVEKEPGILEARGVTPLFHVLLIDKVVHYPIFKFAGLFGSDEVLLETLEDALAGDDKFIISVSYFLYKDKVMQVASSKGKAIDPFSLSIRDAIETIGLTRVIEEVGLARVIEEVGLARVIEEVGLARVIEEVGLARVIEEVGLARVIDEVGWNRLFQEIGVDKVEEELQKYKKQQEKKPKDK